MKYLFTIFITIWASLAIFAQSDIDALRYSTILPGGTARALSIGGSFGAVGSDFSTLSTNPAGLGGYRSGSLMFSPLINLGTAASEFGGTTTNTRKVDVDLNNLGIVWLGKNKDKHVKSNRQYKIHQKVKEVNFGIGINRLADFDRKVEFSGTTRGTIAERYVQLANGTPPSDLNNFDEGLAYDALLIYEDSTFQYYSDLDAFDEVEKSHTLTSKGSITEFSLGVGVNYEHKLFLGASLGIPMINYEEETQYRENDRIGVDTIFNNLLVENNFTTSGSGMNLKLGIIYKVSKQFRLGLAYHTPTRINLTDTFGGYLETTLAYPDINELTTYTAEPPNTGVYSYRLVTPMRGILSALMFIPKRGFITAEGEWVNYGAARMRFDDADFNYEQQVNGNIQDKYQNAFNLRLGAEAIIAKEWRARLGYGYYSSPFDPLVVNLRPPKQIYSFGAGYYRNRFSFDVSYSFQSNQEFYIPYSGLRSPNTQVADNAFTNHSLLMTVAFRFERRTSDTVPN